MDLQRVHLQQPKVCRCKLPTHNPNPLRVSHAQPVACVSRTSTHTLPLRTKLRCDVCNVGENPSPPAAAAGFGGGGIKCPVGKWACQMCTVHNVDALFYCDACEHARPDLATMRF